MGLFRRRAKAAEPATDNVDLSDGDHAWWASSRVQHAPSYAPEAPDGDGAPDAQGRWDYRDVFAADVNGAIDREFGPQGADSPRPDDEGRDLAEVFAEESAFRALGLEPGAPWDDVVVAHRRIAKRYHPDRLIHAEDHERVEGEQKMIEANAAYETLRRLQRTHRPVTGFFTT